MFWTALMVVSAAVVPLVPIGTRARALLSQGPGRFAKLFGLTYFGFSPAR